MIADSLCIFPGTVHTHIKNIYKKLHVSSNAQAVAKAIREKLV
ncbi:MAG: LuxR C-terminal-related transcriptional regulator [Calditrichia bacterium]